MNIDSIKNGYVIDHIQAGSAMRIYQFLRLEEMNCPVAMIMNASSNAMGRKDIIKIDTEIEMDLNVLGYIDPDVTINVIKNSERVAKYHPELPEKIVNVIRCKNPRCITTTEQEIPQVFLLTDREKHTYRCMYCETKAANA